MSQVSERTKTNAELYAQYITTITTDSTTRHLTEQTSRILDDADTLKKLAKQYAACGDGQQQGRMFEQLETLKFNMDSLSKNAKYHAVTTESLGDPHAAADILIKKGAKTIREVQAKSYNDAAKSVYAQTQDKYQGMDRLIPTEQYDKGKELLDKRIETGTLKAGEYQDTREHLAGELKHADVRSGGTTRQEALDATNEKVASTIASKTKVEAVVKDMHYSGLQAAKMGGGLTGGISVIGNGIKLYQGDIEFGEALLDVTVSTAKGAATAYATTALSKGIEHVTKDVVSKPIGAALVKSNGHLALATGIVQSTKSLVSYLKGDIDADTLYSEVSHTAVTGSTCFYYGAFGQMVIPVPIVGAVIGSAVGYFIGNMLHQSGLLALGECTVVKIARERRENIERFCLAAIPAMRAERLAFEEAVAREMKMRHQELTIAFDAMEASMLSDEPEKYLNNLDLICQKFGKSLRFKSFEEFDDMMRNKKQVFVF